MKEVLIINQCYILDSQSSRSSSRSLSPNVGIFNKGSDPKASNLSNATMKNYMLDNKNFKELHLKKCVELKNDSTDEFWILQCPKSIDITELVGSKINLDAGGSIDKFGVDVCTERFLKNRLMTVAAPQILANNQIVSNSVKLLKSVGFVRIKRTMQTIDTNDIEDFEFLSREESVRPVLCKKSKNNSEKKSSEPSLRYFETPFHAYERLTYVNIFHFSSTKSSRVEAFKKTKRKISNSESESNQPQAKKIKMPKPIKIKKETTEMDELSWLKN